MASSEHVYQGVWINWTENRFLGATITLSSSRASILIALFAIVIKVTGDRFWAILRFALYQRRSARKSQDVLHQRQQVILRNTTSDIVTAWEFLQLIWPSPTSSSLRRSLPIMMLAFFNFAIWTALGIFWFRLVRAPGKDEVLVRSPDCGLYLYAVSPQYANLQVGNETRIADDYVATCYNTGGASGNERCNIYVSQTIPWKGSMVECPFEPEVCSTGAQAYEMDTGMVDSHTLLGINSKPEERVFYRRRTTCAILNTDDYANVTRLTSSNDINISIADYHYGALLDQTSTFQVLLAGVYGKEGYELKYGCTPIAL